MREVRCSDGREMDMAQLFSRFKEYLAVGSGQAIYCHMYERVEDTFCCVLVENKISVGKVNGTSFVMKILEW